ncbi:MAG: hypothetical protein ABIJ58_02855 [Nanoarchaeota archaeon]
MKTSKLPFSDNLIPPSEFKDMRTSELMEKGPFFSLRYPGLVHYMPLGHTVLDNLRSIIGQEHSSMGAMEIEIPSYMRRSVLDEGEKITNTFSDKFIMLPPPMEDYMVLTTHEMEILDWLRKDNLTHRLFPLKFFFSKGIFRPIKDPKKILKLRDVEVQAMISLDLDQEGFRRSLSEYAETCESIFSKLRIPYEKRVSDEGDRANSHMDFDLEYFYKCEEGGTMFSLSESGEERALSLSMGYNYKPSQGFIRVMNGQGKLRDPVVGSYAMGLMRLLYSTFNASRDSFGFNLPEGIRPFDVSVLAFGDESEVLKKSEEIYGKLSNEGKKVLFDDRLRTRRKDKARLSDYLGIPLKIVISKSGVREYKRDN